AKAGLRVSIADLPGKISWTAPAPGARELHWSTLAASPPSGAVSPPCPYELPKTKAGIAPGHLLGSPSDYQAVASACTLSCGSAAARRRVSLYYGHPSHHVRFP